MKTRVLIVDDSSVVRTLLSRILASDPDIEVVGTAPDPYVARDKLVALKPDVMTLDIEMPRMDGLTFLEKVMKHFPTRTVIISSLSTAQSATALRALELGAIDVLEKPALDVTKALNTMADDIRAKVKTAACARLRQPLLHSPVATPAVTNRSLIRTTHQILAIASSTGGTEALKVVLSRLPEDIPGTVIVQHMPPVFTRTYADHLQQLCRFEVKEAEDGDRILPGRALLAPGNFHMEVTRNGAYYHVKLHQEPILHGVRPAADYLMNSVAKYAGANAIGLILTGMGRDGAAGLLNMKKAGSFNIAQDESTCVVFGMPKAAIEAGAIDAVLPLERIHDKILDRMKERAAS
ncbi:MAG: chemotaxis response regulator protein-glutamate methylesterase [Bdellovibrionales bacterium GWB1_55_8]|nr:MAG: chemotaxis response regulator protein-glutamate methylesterase [Bdellovibrionales bacterium GWB1_55_8]